MIEEEVCLDHIHMLSEISLKMSVSSFVGILKGKSSLIIFVRHANLNYKYGNQNWQVKHFTPPGTGSNNTLIVPSGSTLSWVLPVAISVT